MSGSSAIASARRRRTAPNETPVQNIQTNQVNVNNQQITSQETITPLELLKQHEDILSQLDLLIDTRSETIVTKKIEELNLLQNTNLKESGSNTDLDNNIKEVINDKISKNDTIKSLLLNIERFEELSNLNNNYIKKIDELTEEVNTLKMLLIKNQTLAIETHTDMLKMKDLQSKHDINLENINKNIDNEDNHLKHLQSGNIFESLLMSSLNQKNEEEYILKSESNSENEYDNKKITIEDTIDIDNIEDHTINIIKNEVKEKVTDMEQVMLTELVENIEETEGV
tara:strand:+ start:69 stop:920 length:852 start_codon:yes stop_codon:yes gene_type:complete